jgi:regulator of RNase E activity RraA
MTRLVSLVGSMFCLLTVLHASDPELASSDVADATEQLTGHRAHMTHEIRLIAGGRLAGPAITLRLVRDDTASSAAAGLAAINLLENAEVGSVVVAALDDDKAFAVFGASFAELARSRRLAGFVVDGSVRDVPELRRQSFPTFARGAAPGSAGGHYRLAGANVPMMCGGIEVKPGDYVIADEDGIAVAPQGLLSDVLTAAKKIQRDEQALLRLIKKHGSYLQAIREQNAAKPKS